MNQIYTDLADTTRTQIVGVNWFPYAHVELQLMERLQFPSGASSASTLFFQVHYSL